MRPMPASLHARRRGGRDERAVGRHDGPQPRGAGGRGDRKDVGPQERLAAGEDEDRRAGGGDLLDEREALGGGELAVVGAVQGGGAAVGARQVAAARHLPGHDARRARVERRAPAAGLAGRDVGGRMTAVAGGGAGDAVAVKGRLRSLQCSSVLEYGECGGGGQPAAAVARPRRRAAAPRPLPAEASAPRLWRGR